MEILSEEIATRSLRQSILLMQELEESPAWQDFLKPEIESLTQAHTEAAINPDLDPAERATHLQAIHTLRSLARYPQNKISELESQWKTEAKKR